jgi:hypothetical protein
MKFEAVLELKRQPDNAQTMPAPRAGQGDAVKQALNHRHGHGKPIIPALII